MVSKYWIIVVSLFFVFTGCSTVELVTDSRGEDNNQNSLPVLGQAPELTGSVWLNTDQPMRLEELRGSVVLLEMWTFG